MDLVTAITTGRSLLELGQEIAKVVKIAKDSPDVRKCDVSDSDEVNALWTRLDHYLHEDNIRP